MKPRISAVKLLALQHGLSLYQPEGLKDGVSQQPLAAMQGVKAMVVAAYGLILPQAILDLPRYGCINVHASLLPRWRGAAPIPRAIEAGDRETGITIMQMDAGLDTGAILGRRAVAISPDDTAATLEQRLATLGAQMLIEVLGGLHAVVPRPQESTGATYATKITKAEAVIDWSRPAHELERRIRAFNPYPGASTLLAGTPLKIWGCTLGVGSGKPGAVLAVDDQGILVGCGDGTLRLTELQKAGARRLPAKDFLRGATLRPGDVLGCSPAQ